MIIIAQEFATDAVQEVAAAVAEQNDDDDDDRSRIDCPTIRKLM